MTNNSETGLIWLTLHQHFKKCAHSLSYQHFDEKIDTTLMSAPYS